MSDHRDGRVQELEARLAERDEVRQQLTEARDALDRETGRLGTIELALELAQAEIDRLESLGAASLLSSLLGTKAGKLDAARDDLAAVQDERKECEQAVQGLTKTVEELEGRLASYAEVEAEYRELVAACGPGDARADLHSFAHDVQMALDAGKSLLNSIGGMYGLCSRLRSGSTSMFAPRGAVFAAAVHAWKSKTAGGVTGQIAGAVEHFRYRLGQLPLGPDCLPDVGVMMVRLEPFADTSALDANAGADSWAELESVTKGIVSDLEDELKRIEC